MSESTRRRLQPPAACIDGREASGLRALGIKVPSLGFRGYLGIQKPAVLRVRPYN